MQKKVIKIFICVTILIFSSEAIAHESFTWFGLKRNVTEVVIKSSNHHSIEYSHHKCPICDKKHKHKPKPQKHKGHKKWHHHLKWWD